MASDSETMSQDQPTPNRENEPSAHRNEAESRIAPRVTAPGLEPQKCHYEITCEAKKNWWEKAMPLVEMVGVILLGIYTAYTIKMYCANKEAADAAQTAAKAANLSAATEKSALEDVQRAFVSQTYTQTQENNTWIVQVRWDNSGDTPTKDMIMHVSFSGLRSAPLPRDFRFPDIWESGEPRTPTSETIPAKGQGQAIYIGIPLSLIKAPSYFYVWGWAHYRDVFAQTTEHVTEFCDEFDTTAVESNKVFLHTLGMDTCARHNCSDGQCKDAK